MQATYAITHAFAIFLLASSLFGAVLGLQLIFRLEMFRGISLVANRWISIQGLERALNYNVNLEHWFHRRHRLIGIFMVLGALYILFYFGIEFDKAHMLRHLNAALSFSLRAALLDALVLLALSGATLALCTGFVLWVRPELLHGIEAYANRWISMQHLGDLLDARHDQLDQLTLLYARPIGMLLLVASVYLFFRMLQVSL